MAGMVIIMDTAFFYRVLSVIHQTQSITATAEILNYTQSGLSHAIRRFENELDFKLLIRHKTGVTLTKEAMTLLPIAQEIAHNLNRLDDVISQINGDRSQTLTLGTFSSVVRQAFPEITAAYSKEYPDIEIHIKKGSVEDLQYWLKSQIIDVAITSHQPEDSFGYIKLIDEPMYAIVPISYGKSCFDIRDMGMYPFIMPSNGDLSPDSDIEKILKDHHLKLNVHLISTDWSSIPKMVESGLGMSILPTLILRNRSEKVAFLPLDPPCYRELIIAHKPFQHTPGYIQHYIGCTQAVISDGHLFSLPDPNV